MSTAHLTTKTKKALTAKKNLESYAEVVDKRISDYFKSEFKQLFGVSNKEKKLTQHIFEHIKDYNLRPAKRLRASFVYYGYKLLGGTDEEEVITASISVELIHTGLLIHDDFMDQDDTRRGKDTTH